MIVLLIVNILHPFALWGHISNLCPVSLALLFRAYHNGLNQPHYWVISTDIAYFLWWLLRVFSSDIKLFLKHTKLWLMPYSLVVCPWYLATIIKVSDRICSLVNWILPGFEHVIAAWYIMEIKKVSISIFSIAKPLMSH